MIMRSFGSAWALVIVSAVFTIVAVTDSSSATLIAPLYALASVILLTIHYHYSNKENHGRRT